MVLNFLPSYNITAHWDYYRVIRYEYNNGELFLHPVMTDYYEPVYMLIDNEVDYNTLHAAFKGLGMRLLMKSKKQP